MENVVSAFSLEQASRLTGVVEHTLMDWDRDDFFSPSMASANRRSPYSRVYNFEDVVALRTLAILRGRVSMQHLKKAADCLKAHSGRPWSELTLYTLNGEVHFKHPSNGVIEGAVSGQYGATIPIESVAEEMHELANALRVRDPKKVGQIERDRFVMGNAYVFAGTRIPVADVVSLLGAGYSAKEVVSEFPDLKLADVKAAKAFESDLTQAA